MRLARAAAYVVVVFLAAALPAAGARAEGMAVSRIAFGSCMDQDEPQPAWDAVLAWRPELFLFLGDNVYGGRPGPGLVGLRAAYARAARVEGMARAMREVPHLATWDDHDMGANDGGGDFPLKDGAKALFLDFWRAPADDPRRTRGGLYDARVIGPEGRRVQVIMLDTRYFRSPLRPTDERGAPGKERYLPDEDPGKTMLGEEQWAWLAEQLRRPAELRLVASSVQVLAEGHGWERWGNLPRERRRLVALIRETGADGVVFLSGDRHLAAFYDEAGAGAPYPLVEVTSSGINKAWTTPSDLPGNRAGEPYGAPNFGTVEIDWDAGELGLAVRDAGGAVVRRRRVRLDSLRAPR